jgi:hypothetical protein
MDVALFGPQDSPATVALCSGTHGVEGFVGSGIQTGLLQAGIASSLPAGVCLVMIHALNPYGMAHLRRFTEENVDLNRNFRDHTRPPPGNSRYDAVAGAIAPRSMSLGSEIGAWGRLLWFRFTAGKGALGAAIQGGQYSHPTGLFYGGMSDAWSNVTLRSIVRDCLSHTKRLVAIDIHTGLGAYGAAEIILNVPSTASAFQRALEIWKPECVRSTVPDGLEPPGRHKSVSAHLHSSVKLAFSGMLRGAEVTAVSLEFGTLSRLQVFWALRAENWVHHHGGWSHPKAPGIKQRLLRAFHPDDEAWEARVWSEGSEVVSEALVWAGGGGNRTG